MTQFYYVMAPLAIAAALGVPAILLLDWLGVFAAMPGPVNGLLGLLIGGGGLVLGYWVVARAR